MNNVLAMSLMEALEVPEAELEVARANLCRLGDPDPDERTVLITWLVMAFLGNRKDVHAAVLDLRKANTMTIRYIREVLSQADQFQDNQAPSPPSLGDDPHGGR